MDFEYEESNYFKLKTKCKNQTHLPRLDYLELKPKTRNGKCVGAALEYLNLNKKTVTITKPEPKDYTYISNDVWFHLADYIAPEDVQRYALICRQSAESVNSRRFWLQLYKRFCLQSTRNTNECALQLPERLQMLHKKGYDKSTLRQRVIQALYYCYDPFIERSKTSYELETLVGRMYVSSWYENLQCGWVMCYKFKQHLPLSSPTSALPDDFETLKNRERENDRGNVVCDWELLADDDNNSTKIIKSLCYKSMPISTTSDLDGTSLLVIYCDRFIPFPSDILYNYGACSYDFIDGRSLLSLDMRNINLELDFASATRCQPITVRYAKVKKFEVLPWWHPHFTKFNKCE